MTVATYPLERVRGAFPALAREVNGKPVAYLDSGASAQRVLASIQAVDRYERRHHSNVHRGSHTLSAEATAAYEGARATVADHIGAADRREVIFVRNATEAINLVARAWGAANVGQGDRIVLTEMEHHSNIVPWQQLAEAAGAEIDWVPVTDDGLLDLDAFEGLLERGPKLVAVAHVSNVLGTVNPIAEIARLAHDAGALVLVDGAQAAPKLPLDMAELGGRLLRHHRPQALRADRDRRAVGAPGAAARDAAVHGRRLDDPQGHDRGDHLRRPARPLRGGHAGDRPGDRDGRGAALARRPGDGRGARPRAGDRRLRAGAARRGARPARLRAAPAPDRLGPVSFELEGIHAHDVSEILDRHGVAVRAGHHCAQPLMDRLGVAATARASFGVYTTPEEIDRLVDGLHDARRIFGEGL